MEDDENVIDEQKLFLKENVAEIREKIMRNSIESVQGIHYAKILARE